MQAVVVFEKINAELSNGEPKPRDHVFVLCQKALCHSQVEVLIQLKVICCPYVRLDIKAGAMMVDGIVSAASVV